MWIIRQWKSIIVTACAALVGGFLSWVMVLGFMEAWPIIINFVLNLFREV